MPLPRVPALALFALLTLPAGAATFDGTLPQPFGPSDGRIGAVQRPAAATSESIAAALRDRADLAGIADQLPALLEADPSDGLARAVLAIGRAIEEGPGAARALLAATPSGVELPDPEAALARALISRGEGDLASAADFARRALAAAPNHAYAHHVLGTVVYRTDGAEAALPHFAEAARAAPEGATYRINHAAILAEAGRPEAARDVLEQALALAPGSCTGLIGLARLERLAGRLDAAVARFRDCLAVAPDEPIAAQGIVAAHLQAGDFDAAEAALDELGAVIAETGLYRAEIALRRGLPDAARARLDDIPEGPARALVEGRIALMQDDPTRAVAAFETVPAGGLARAGLWASALASDAPLPEEETSTDPTTALMQALSQLAASDPGAARAHLDRATGVVPGFAADGLSQADLAAVAPELARAAAVPLYLYLTRTGGGAEALIALAETAPDAALIQVFAAEAALPDAAAALTHLDRAVAASPGFASAQAMRAGLLMAEGRLREAFDGYAAAVEIRPEPALLVRVGLLGEVLGEDAAAEAAYRAFLKTEPASYIALNQLAWFLATRADDLSEARTLATEALEIKPGNAAILDTLGWIAFREGDMPLAIARLEEAAEAAGGGAPEIDLHLAEAYIAADQVPRARDVLEKVVPIVRGTPLEARAEDLSARASVR